MADDAIEVTLDGRTIEARPKELLIAAAERHGVYIPRFCYHPRMRPVGMCRMCIVDVDTGRGPALQPSCMLECTPGMVVDTQNERTKKAQDGVLEFLLINHPLDCPVCDKGGECPLQDQTLTFGPGETRFVEEKRHYEKPIALSDLVLMDRERCILCDRCTRFASEVAGDPLIHFIRRGAATEVNTFPDHPFASYFSGNTVQICPVGALTSKPYRFKARPWDLEQVESTCQTCSFGCRIAVQSSANRLTRYLGLDSDPVNHGWLCDKGRYAYDWVNNESRVQAPQVRKPGTGPDELVEASWGEALAAAAKGITEALSLGGPGAVAVLGGARLANEDAYAWAKLAKGVIGTDSVDCQLGDGLPAEVVLGLPRATIDQACAAKAVVLLCGDPKEELPVLHLRLREAAVERGLPIVEVVPRSTSLGSLAASTVAYSPGCAAVAMRALLGDADPTEPVAGVAVDALGAARKVLADAGDDVVVVLGRPSVAETADSIADAALAFATARPGARFLPALRRGNVHGALDMGLAPGLLPGRVSLEDDGGWFAAAWGSVPAQRGSDATGILQAASEGRIRALVLLGADPLSDFPDRELARRALTGASFVVAVDCFVTPSSRHADVVLPAAGFAERPGTTTNIEGRITRLGQKVVPNGTAWADWMIATELAARLGHDLGFERFEEIWGEIERLSSAHAGITAELLRTPGYVDGIVAPLAEGSLPDPPRPIDRMADPGIAEVEVQGPDQLPTRSDEPAGGEVEHSGPTGESPDGDTIEAADAEREGDGYGGTSEQSAAAEATVSPTAPEAASTTERPAMLDMPPSVGTPELPLPDSYSLRLVAFRKLYDAGVLVQATPGLAALAAPVRVHVHPADLDRLGVTSGGRVRVTSPRTTQVLDAVADPGVPRGSAAIPFNAVGFGAADLIDVAAPVTDVRIETV